MATWQLGHCDQVRLENTPLWHNPERREFFHLALLRHQNIKTTLNFLEENHWARPFFALFSSIREKLQFTVSFCQISLFQPNFTILEHLEYLELGQFHNFCDVSLWFHIVRDRYTYIRLYSFHFFRHHLNIFTLIQLEDWYHDISHNCAVRGPVMRSVTGSVMGLVMRRWLCYGLEV